MLAFTSGSLFLRLLYGSIFLALVVSGAFSFQLTSFPHYSMNKQAPLSAPGQGISRRVNGFLQNARIRGVKRASSGLSVVVVDDTPGGEELNSAIQSGGDTTTLEEGALPTIGNGENFAAMELSRSTSAESLQKSKWISMLDDPSVRTGRILVVVASAIYGTNFATVKLLDDAMPLSISAALRFGLAAAVVAAIVISNESEDVDEMEAKERTDAAWAGAEIGLWYSIGYIAQAEGLQTVAAGKSAFFNSLAVIIVPLLDVFFKGKVLRNAEMAAVALSCMGVGLLELGPTGDITITPGDLMAFTQTFFFGIGYWRLEEVSHAHQHQAARVTVGQLTAVAAGSVVFAFTEFLLGHEELSPESFVEWLGDPFIIVSLLWTGLISTALALYLETVALKVISATELTLLMTTVSLWGAAFAFVTIGERLSAIGMAGGALIMAGCVLGNIGPKNNKTLLTDIESVKADS